MKTLVTGKIIFGVPCAPFSSATVYIRLEDVTYADASSKVIAETVLKNVSSDAPAEQSIRFSIEGESPSSTARCNISVHVDVDNDGQISKGDYINTQSFPALTQGNSDKVDVKVALI